MAIDLYNTRTMLEALLQMLPAKSFLKDTFFGTKKTYTSKYVDIDIRKGKRRLAPYVRPTSQAKVVERIGYTTRAYEAPYIKEKMVSTAQDFLDRAVGTDIYGPGDGPQERANSQMGEDLADMSDMITRSEEVQCSQLLNTGIVTVDGEGYNNEQIDFGMSATHIITLTGTDLWTDAASDPIKDFRIWSRLLVKDGGLGITDAILGADVEDAFYNNTIVQNLLDNRRMEMGKVDPQAMGDGVVYIGRLKGTSIDLWSYDEWYLDPVTGVETPMVAVDKILFMNRNAYTRAQYAAIQDLKANAAVPRFPKSWEEEDPSVRFLMVQSAPLMSMHQVDAFGAATVV